uniref:Uncharacterized protein n=1 Tax=Steinernema glaseri TaxID=37863 RepID=A0A1I7Z6J0_9BILA
MFGPLNRYKYRQGSCKWAKVDHVSRLLIGTLLKSSQFPQRTLLSVKRPLKEALHSVHPNSLEKHALWDTRYVHSGLTTTVSQVGGDLFEAGDAAVPTDGLPVRLPARHDDDEAHGGDEEEEHRQVDARVGEGGGRRQRREYGSRGLVRKHVALGHVPSREEDGVGDAKEVEEARVGGIHLRGGRSSRGTSPGRAEVMARKGRQGAKRIKTHESRG